jgi:tRNA pseudouridine38-40 synthase
VLRTLKLTLEYEGTRYGGWQRQANRVTVQQVLEEALADLVDEEVKTVAAGRTDSGVHAEGQVVSFLTRSRFPARAFVFGVNARLPEDVAVLAAEEAAEGFHAQRDAKGKLYRYRILNRETPAPLSERFCHRVPEPLDAGRMADAAARLVGRHDFSAFRNAGSVPGSAVRCVDRLDIERLDDYISIETGGDGFLYRMVRNLVGTLILAGRGRLSPEEVGGILASRDRSRAGPTAPARGLCLVEVFY